MSHVYVLLVGVIWRSEMSELTDALDTLADMFEYGHLQAQTDPVGFIRSVQDRITELEKEVAYYEQENKYIKAVVEQNDRLRVALKKSHIALRLLNSMILSGEQHSPQSVAAYKQALEGKE